MRPTASLWAKPPATATSAPTFPTATFGSTLAPPVVLMLQNEGGEHYGDQEEEKENALDGTC